MGWLLQPPVLGMGWDVRERVPINQKHLFFTVGAVVLSSYIFGHLYTALHMYKALWVHQYCIVVKASLTRILRTYDDL